MKLQYAMPCAGLLILNIAFSLPVYAVTVAGGSAHFTGTVMNAACAVALEDNNLEVQMGQVRKAELASVGSWADPVSFTLSLTDCDTSVSQTAGISFDGNTDSKDPMVLSTDNGPGSASGVGLGIYDEQSNLVVPNSAPRSYKTLIDGLNVLHFIAKYRATNTSVTSGDASVTANFIVVYQ